MTNKTCQEPFGPHNGTLIVCHNTYHAIKVAEALELQAFYLPGWQCILAGHRFNRIIVFQPVTAAMSDREIQLFERWYREVLPTKLAVGCTQNIFLV